MTTQEHLERIVAKCRELLAIAEKRTPGKWETGFASYQVVTSYRTNGKLICEMMTNTSSERDEDAAYIAACTGSAESGWRATIAAIEALREIEENGFAHCDKVIAIIIDAWPEELL